MRFLGLVESPRRIATESAVLRDLFKLQASFRHANVVEEYSRRSEDSIANPSPRTGDSVANPSPRTRDSVANPSWRFYGSPRNIYTLSSFFWRSVYQKSMKIGDPQAQLPILLRDSKNLGEYLA
jgi:hypothetical protein